MEKEMSEKKRKIPHQVAEKLETAIRKRLSEKQAEKNLSDAALGERAYAPLGYDDFQKKVNNLMRGKTGMKLSDFYIVCEALGLQPDRVFSSALDSVLSQSPAATDTAAPFKNADPEAEASTPIRPNLPARKPGDGVQPIVGGSSEAG